MIWYHSEGRCTIGAYFLEFEFVSDELKLGVQLVWLLEDPGVDCTEIGLSCIHGADTVSNSITSNSISTSKN